MSCCCCWLNMSKHLKWVYPFSVIALVSHSQCILQMIMTKYFITPDMGLCIPNYGVGKSFLVRPAADDDLIWLIILCILYKNCIFFHNHSKYHCKSFHLDSVFPLHSSTSWSINFFLHLQFSWSKYCPMSDDLSHSNSQIIGFQINPLSHLPL